MVDQYELHHKRRLHIIPLGDLHVGARNCNYDYIEYAIRTINQLKGPKRVYMMGDLLETADKRVGGSVFEQDMSLDDQVCFIRDLLKPISDDIVFFCRGNHEERLIRMYDLDLTRLLAEDFGVGYGYQCHDEFLVNGRQFKVMAYHGKGSSRSPYLAYGKLVRELGNFKADLYLYGHLHMTGAYREFYWSPEGVSQKVYVLSGHFMKYWSGYAEAGALTYSPEGFGVCNLNKDCFISYNPFHIHERRPDLLVCGDGVG